MAYQIFLKERRKKTMVTINEIIALAERAKNGGIRDVGSEAAIHSKSA